MDEDFGPAAMAIFVGDLDELGRLLSDDPSLSSRRSSVGHPTLLQLVACEEPKLADPVGAARLLFEAGAATGQPLVAAAGCDSRAVLELLLDLGVGVDGEDPWTPLDEALYWSNHDIAAFLIERGAEVRSLRAAAGLGDMARLNHFFVDGPVGSDAGPIHSPFPETVSATEAVDPQAIVDHAFVMAVNNGRRPAAGLLEAKGARVNAKPPGYHWHGTALHAAVWRGDAAMVEWLLSIGADKTVRDGLADSDAIGWARHHGHPEIADLLT